MHLFFLIYLFFFENLITNFSPHFQSKMPEFAMAKHVKKLTQDVFKVRITNCILLLNITFLFFFAHQMNCALQKLEREQLAVVERASSSSRQNNENNNLAGVVSKLATNLLDVTKQFKEYCVSMDKRMAEKQQQIQEQASEVSYEKMKKIL